MITVTVLKRFWDRKERVTRNEGDAFVTTDARAYEIKGLLPDYVELGEAGTRTKATRPVHETVEPQVQESTVEPEVANDTELAEVPQADSETKQDDLSELTVAELKELCNERGIEVPKRAKKAQLIELLEG